MKVPRFKFTPIAIAELIACVIILPLVISTITSGFNNKKYYESVSGALNAFNVGDMKKAERLARKAIDARPAEDAPLLLLGRIEYENKNFDKAQKTFEEARDLSSDKEKTAAISIMACKLYKLDTKERLDVSDFSPLERDIKYVLSENEGCPGAFIISGHIHIKKAKLYAKKKQVDKEETEMIAAESAFNKALKESPEQPPTKSSCYSLYLGMAIVNQWKAKEALKKNPNPTQGSDAAHEIATHFKKMALNLRGALYYRYQNPKLFDHIQHVYGRLLSYKWLEDSMRRELIADADNYIYTQMRFLKNHLQGIRRKDLVKKLGVEDSTGYMANGLAIAYYYIEDYRNADNCFNTAQRQRAKMHNVDLITYSQIQLQLLLAGELFSAKDAKTSNKGKGRLKQILKRTYRPAMLRIVKDAMPKKKPPRKLTEQEFIIINNCFMLTAKFEIVEGNPDTYRKFANLGERKLMPLFPNKLYDIGLSRKVRAREVFRHNLYYLYKRLGIKKNAKWRLPLKKQGGG